jgi:putative methanogenesis marker domain 9
MLEVGYLNLDNPIAIISSYRRPASNGSAGLLLLDGFDLDKISMSEVESSLEKVDTKAAIGFSVSCSDGAPIIEAARLASRNLYLLDLNISEADKGDMLLDLIPKIKRCGTTLSVRIKPEDLSDDVFLKLNDAGTDMIHLDLQGLNGAGPKVVKKASDGRGPIVMALGDVGDFEDARDLMAMGADLVSLRGADPEFAEWLAGAMKEYDALSGWYNAPKHICSGGDLRGLAFCCPPVKRCPVLGALKKAGMTPDEFVEKKLRLVKGTPLEKGDGTCFGSLTWCCKVSKPCYLRDAALARIGLSGKEYMALKRKLAEDLLRA